MDFFRAFLAAFIPLFVAIDPAGLVPVFVGVTEFLPARRRRLVALEAVGAALLICIAFMFLGHATFRFLSISEADFKIAGGLILLVLAIIDILSYGKPAVHETEMIGIVPLAMPMIAGPATLTTLLVLSDTAAVGYFFTGLALIANLAIVLAALAASTTLARVIGPGAMRGISKVVMVLLAAIAVAYIRTGITEALAAARH